VLPVLGSQVGFFCNSPRSYLFARPRVFSPDPQKGPSLNHSALHPFLFFSKRGPFCWRPFFGRPGRPPLNFIRHLFFLSLREEVACPILSPINHGDRPFHARRWLSGLFPNKLPFREQLTSLCPRSSHVSSNNHSFHQTEVDF